MKRFLMVLMIMVMLPYVTTMAWTGRIGGGDFTGFEELAGAGQGGSQGSSGTGAGQDGSQGSGLTAGRRYVAVERNGRTMEIPAEDFLVHALAAQIPADFGPETLKAQAVLARTYIYREMDGAETIPEEALDMDALSGAQMEELWGGACQENYHRLQEAVSATGGLYLAYEGAPAEGFFCRAASGRTRAGGQAHPCLRQAESPGDLLADGYLSIAVFAPEDLARRVSAIPGAVSVDADRLPEELQVAERDEAGYVLQVQIGPKTYSGEEVQYALGLSSPCFYFDELQGKIRVTCKGIGHGYGFSQAGASALEKEGLGFEALLDHYFQNVEILKEGI